MRYAYCKAQMGMKSTGGEIVKVQGGHIVRSTGRKDRHSKVYTAKGPRDRRVRLSAPTAIQFYDVQDRLGYDRPSKAVDWLIKKAKAAIDKLAVLPPWQPDTASGGPDEAGPNVNSTELGAGGGGGGERSESSGYENFQIHRGLGGANLNNTNTSSFFSSGSDAILADTMKSFFPTSSGTSSINFSSYPQDIISRSNTNNQHQDLGLSLQSFPFPSLMNSQEQNHTTPQDHTLFTSNSISAPMAFEPGYPRMVAWNNNEATTDNRGVGGFLFNSPIPALAAQPLIGQASVVFPQREPLQSSFSQAFRGYGDLPISSGEHQHQSSVFGSRYSTDGLPGFCIPVQAQLGEEHEGSASPNSGH